MRRLWTGPALALALQAAAPALAQEQIPPIPIGGNRAVKLQLASQLVDLSATGIVANVHFFEVSNRGIVGFAVRTSGGTTSGQVTVLWQNHNLSVALDLDQNNPMAPFELLAPPPRRSPVVRQRN